MADAMTVTMVVAKVTVPSRGTVAMVVPMLMVVWRAVMIPAPERGPQQPGEGGGATATQGPSRVVKAQGPH